jgi:glycosyltransferase involved in cell wall biosynthesis
MDVRPGNDSNPAGAIPRVLSLSCLYPNPAQPGSGLFVQRRLQHLAELVPLQVVAPFSVVHYGGTRGNRIRFGKSRCPQSSQDGKVNVLHIRWGYPPYSGSVTAIWLFLALLLPVARIRKRSDFDVIDTHFGHPEGVAGYLLSLALGIPFTMTLRGNEPRHGAAGLGRRLMSLAVRRASRVFTVSERLRQFAIGLGAEPGKVKTIPNGVDTSVFFARDRVQSRIRHNLPLDRPLILSAGALVERKGHHRIVEVLGALSVSGTQPHLLIAGGPGPEGQYEERIRKLVADLGLDRSVHFLGPVPAAVMAELMSAADVFCLSSTNEGWPNVVHEALACGTPVVATDVGAVPDMLAAGRYGHIVPVDDRDALRFALQTALEKNWDRTAIAAWGQARSWSQVAREVFTELQQIVTENRLRTIRKSSNA